MVKNGEAVKRPTPKGKSKDTNTGTGKGLLAKRQSAIQEDKEENPSQKHRSDTEIMNA